MRAASCFAAISLCMIFVTVSASAAPPNAGRDTGPLLTENARPVDGVEAVAGDQAPGSTATGCVTLDGVPNVARSDCEFLSVDGNTAELARGGCFIQFDVMLSNFACAGDITTWLAEFGPPAYLPAGLSQPLVFIDAGRPDGFMSELPACSASVLGCGGAMVVNPPRVDNGQPVYLMSIKLFVEPGVVGTLSLPFSNPGIDTFLIDVDGFTHTIGKPNPGVIEILPGQCCNLGLVGGCIDNVFKDECDAQFPTNFFVPGNTCADPCPPVTFGACCDSDPFVGGCRDNVSEGECNGASESFFPGSLCAQVACDIVVPTVSEWGLVVMALLLLTGAKVYYHGGWKRGQPLRRCHSGG